MSAQRRSGDGPDADRQAGQTRQEQQVRHTVALYLAKNLTPLGGPTPNERVFYPDAEAIIEIVDAMRAGRDVSV
jgi:hypothetical protein